MKKTQEAEEEDRKRNFRMYRLAGAVELSSHSLLHVGRKDSVQSEDDTFNLSWTVIYCIKLIT